MVTSEAAASTVFCSAALDLFRDMMFRLGHQDRFVFKLAIIDA